MPPHSHPCDAAATFPQVVAQLRDLVGPRLVAYLGSARDTRVVHQWADGTREPARAMQQRLLLALQVAAMLSERESPKIAQAWMQGLNPQLDDTSPARLIRDAGPHQAGPAVIGAARAFLVGG
jgi:hypothetical protein